MSNGTKIALLAAGAIGVFVLLKKRVLWRPYVAQEKEYSKTKYFRTYDQIKQFESEHPEYNQRGLVIDADWGYCVVFAQNGETQAYYQIDFDTFNKLRNDSAYEYFAQLT